MCELKICAKNMTEVIKHYAFLVIKCVYYKENFLSVKIIDNPAYNQESACKAAF